MTPAPDDATGIALDIHSHGQLVLWPWGFTSTLAPNGVDLRTLGRKLAFFNGHTPQQGTELYVTDGSSKDFYYGELGVAGFVFELGTAFFESCSYFESSILQPNLDALLYAAKVVRTPFETPAGPEPVSVAASPQPVVAGTLVTLSGVLDDSRFNNSNGTEPTQTVAVAEAYLGLPPWDVSSVALPAFAADGTFDEAVEAVEAAIDTTGLAPGRHLLFLRGQDTAGNWGPVGAAFLDVVDPATAATVQGTVVDLGTLAPAGRHGGDRRLRHRLRSRHRRLLAAGAARHLRRRRLRRGLPAGHRAGPGGESPGGRGPGLPAHPRVGLRDRRLRDRSRRLDQQPRLHLQPPAASWWPRRPRWWTAAW